MPGDGGLREMFDASRSCFSVSFFCYTGFELLGLGFCVGCSCPMCDVLLPAVLFLSSPILLIWPARLLGFVATCVLLPVWNTLTGPVPLIWLSCLLPFWLILMLWFWLCTPVESLLALALAVICSCPAPGPPFDAINPVACLAALEAGVFLR